MGATVEIMMLDRRAFLIASSSLALVGLAGCATGPGRQGAATRDEQLDAILAQHSLAINQGRPARALQLTSELEALQPGTRA